MKRYMFLFAILLGFGFCSAQSSCIVINEFVVDPKDGPNGDASNTGEFVEIYNKCNCSVSIGCFVLCATDNSGGRRGDCITIPAGTSLAAGGTYVVGGFGTNCSGGGVTTCDWPSLSLNLNWHSSATTVWNVAGNAFYTTNVGNYIGVIADGGEDLSLFDNTGAFIYGVYNDGGAGIGTNNTENIGAVAGCSAKSIIIPATASHTNAGNTPGGMGADGGFSRNCDNTWTHVQKASQTPGTPLACTLVSCTLPIELISFDAKHYNNEVELNWITATEKNNNFFSVERSEDAVGFEEILNVKGAGNSNKFKSYTAYDKAPLKSTVSYYRLKQTDFDGKFTYSQIVTLSRANQKQYNFKITPNPSETGIFALTGNIGSDEVTEIEVFDITGKKVSEIRTAENLTVLNLSPFGKGLYFVRIKSDDKIFNYKIIHN